MATDKELIGAGFTYCATGETIKAFVAQADPKIGITIDPVDQDEMESKGFSPGHLACLVKKEFQEGNMFYPVDSYPYAYRAMKRQILSGKYYTVYADETRWKGVPIPPCKISTDIPNCAFD
jgi:hypothetical protein